MADISSIHFTHHYDTGAAAELEAYGNDNGIFVVSVDSGGISDDDGNLLSIQLSPLEAWQLSKELERAVRDYFDKLNVALAGR